MKKPSITGFFCAVALVVALVGWAVGCTATGPAIQSIGLNGTYDPTTEAIGAGVTLVFRKAPTEATRDALLAAGATQRTRGGEAGVTYRLAPLKRDGEPTANERLRARRDALHRALDEGATILPDRVSLSPQGRATAARLAHNQEVAGSNPAPATISRASRLSRAHFSQRDVWMFGLGCGRS